MIEIRKDSLTIQVTKGAFKQIYKPLGWIVIGEEEKIEVKNESLESHDANVEVGAEEEELEEESEEPEESNPEDEELLETPLSDMTLNELYRYAKLMELEIEEGLSKKAAREAIRTAMQ